MTSPVDSILLIIHVKKCSRGEGIPELKMKCDSDWNVTRSKTPPLTKLHPVLARIWRDVGANRWTRWSKWKTKSHAMFNLTVRNSIRAKKAGRLFINGSARSSLRSPRTTVALQSVASAEEEVSVGKSPEATRLPYAERLIFISYWILMMMNVCIIKQRV